MNYNDLTTALANADTTSVVRPHSPEAIPDRKAVIKLVKQLQAALFPGYFNTANASNENALQEIATALQQQIAAACRFSGVSDETAADICDAFMQNLPQIKALLLKDIIALYNGDPAAKCHEEVLLCYPGFYAISIYRLAHQLYQLKVPFLPRIMTEFAHEKTGIDIHAGATIGEYFFIDHGTGIVIGETTVIGDHVKLYQGVTLGAKSFELDEDGNPIKNIKRHPNIGNNVIIYANATILGGNTFIGDNCVIGGNVWLTHSVEPDQVVYYSEKK